VFKVQLSTRFAARRWMLNKFSMTGRRAALQPQKDKLELDRVVLEHAAFPHAELVSASRLEAAERVEDWTLKQVQHDGDRSDSASTGKF
jgi:hypothetical protein